MERARDWHLATIAAACLLLGLTGVCIRMGGDLLTLQQVRTQDVPVLVLAALAALIVAFWAPLWSLPPRLPRRALLLASGLVIVALVVWGTYAITGNYPLSRDEHMVVFDMAVFDKGRLAVPLEPFWRPYAGALVPNFLLSDRMPIGLVSSYLPMNALLRLAFSKLADPIWFNPLLALAGGAALLSIARRTFPGDDRACWVVLLVYALSAQMLVTAMTTYSMTAHMALNLIWLAMFLRGGKLGHAIAIATGFIAVGLHQLVFHPAFVAPFLLWRLRDGEWRLVLIYAAAYAAILLWWIYYPMLASAEVASPAVHVAQADFLTGRVMPLLLHRAPATGGIMVLNLLRFFAWQNLALLPLLVAAVPLAIRERGLAAALYLGIVLWLIFITLVLPYQGNGWGFRYLHPYLGSFALLSGFGYRELEPRIGRQADGMVVLLSGLTALIAIPLLFMAAHRYVAPYLAADRLIAGQREGMVLIDDESSPTNDGRASDNATDLVRNLPDLSNRPLRFSSSFIKSDLLRQLCRRGPVTLITRADLRGAGFGLNLPDGSPKFEALIATVDHAAPGCFRPAAGGAGSLGTEFRDLSQRSPRAR
jgi:hypothetical protein